MAEEPDLTAAQIAAKTGLTRTLAFRILVTLEGERLVEKDAARKTYRLGRYGILLGSTRVHNRRCCKLRGQCWTTSRRKRRKLSAGSSATE